MPTSDLVGQLRFHVESKALIATGMMVVRAHVFVARAPEQHRSCDELEAGAPALATEAAMLHVRNRPGLVVFNEGALFSAGDGHGRQGDGEVCIAAVETALTGRFRLTVRKDMAIATPFAETPDCLMSMGFDEDLDEAMRKAVRDMVGLVAARTGLSRNKAYMLLSLCGDLRITQVVDGEKGVHMLIRKEWLAKPAT